MNRLLLLLLALSPATAAPLEKWETVAKPWDRGLGSHRVVVKVATAAPAVHARLEWRRPDRNPEKKGVLVFDLTTGKEVINVVSSKITGESGEVTFEPVSGAGEYAVYFLPVKVEGGAFPVGRYLPARNKADAAWLQKAAAPVEAEVARWEAISAHDAWTGMEVVGAGPPPSGAKSVRDIPAPLMKDFARIESAGNPVKMFDAIPKQWLEDSADRTLKARPGQYLTFQVVAYRGFHLLDGESPAGGVSLKFSALTGPSGTIIPASGITCFPLQRTDWQGRGETLESYPLPPARIQPLWCGVQLPGISGAYRGTVEVRMHNRTPVTLPVNIEVSGDPVPDHGDRDPQSLSRLRWLNSTTAVDEEPAKGYTPLKVTGRTIACLGRELELGDDGLPVRIRSYFNKAVTKILEKPTLELLRGMTFTVSPSRGQTTVLTGSGFAFTKEAPGIVQWTSRLSGAGARGTLTGSMEFDGSVHYRLSLEPEREAVSLDAAGLNVSRVEDSTDYVLGLQQETGVTPAGFQWAWDTPNKNQDSVWIGAVNGGLRLQLRAENYIRPSVNIHYKRRPLNDPPSWNGGGTGGMTWTGGSGALLKCQSGPVTLEPGKPLHFDFDLLITPFHTLRTREQWADRYYHTGGVPADTGKYLDSAKAAGANVVNIHQGNWLNPYINYPFLTAGKLDGFSLEAHRRGMRAKYYYTVRELSNWCPELFAFRSMGDEILMSGKGGGHPWGEEHLGGNYWQAWYEPTVQDVSFLTQPMSRLHNYYIEGLRWLCENAGCDGIYLDDIAYDRAIMLRARKVLDRYCPRGGLIDLHSWNEFHEGGAWAHCPNLFMDSMPFVDRLWFGEGHHYSGPPAEHFLVELSGIPFGLMGEMLEGGGNPWLGLVHGMTGRLGWGGDPREVWKLWDAFGVQDAEFIGWWAGTENPVQCSTPDVKATVWKKPGATLLALANFSKEPRQAVTVIDWKALGLDPAKAKFYAPPLPGLKQREAVLSPEKPVMLKPYAGAVFIIDEAEHTSVTAAAAGGPGPVILETDFTKGLEAAWKPVLSSKAKEGARVDGGYVLEVPANVHAYLEAALPENASAVSTRLWQDGKDQGQQWGPGLALVWANGKTLRVSLRQDGRLCVSANGREEMPSAISTRAPVEFRLQWDKDNVRVVASGPAMGDVEEELATFPRDRFPGQPAVTRIGKSPNDASARDFGEPGSAGFNRIEWIRVHGPK